MIEFSMKPNAWDSGSHIDKKILDGLAENLQTVLRSRIDTGTDYKASIRSGTLTVRNDSGRLEVRSGDSEDDGRENTTIDDLFRSTSPTPYAEGNKLIFRRIQAEEAHRVNTQSIIHSVKETLSLNIDRYVNEAVNSDT